MTAFTPLTPAGVVDRILSELVPLWAKSADPKFRELAGRLAALPAPVGPPAVAAAIIDVAGPEDGPAFADSVTRLACDACRRETPAVVRYHVDDFGDVFFCRECLLAAADLLPPLPSYPARETRPPCPTNPTRTSLPS